MATPPARRAALDFVIHRGAARATGVIRVPAARAVCVSRVLTALAVCVSRMLTARAVCVSRMLTARAVCVSRVLTARAVCVSRVLTALAVVCATVLATTAIAQPSPDVPGGPGVIRGRLVGPGGPVGVEGIEVVLYALTAEGRAALRRTRSDAAGEFSFEAIAVEPTTVYLVGTRFSEIPFGARVRFEPGELERNIEVEILDTTDDTKAVSHAEATVRASRGCAHVHVWHTHQLHNAGDRVVQIPSEARGERLPLLAVELPPGHTNFETPLGGQGVVVADGVATFWGPLYPGEQAIEFGYGVEANGAEIDLRLGLPGGASELSLLVPPDDLDPSGAVAPRGTLERDGRSYRSFAAGAIARGGTLPLRLGVAEAPELKIGTPRARIWLELDDAAIEVNEVHQLESVGSVPASGPPLLCFPVPPGAEELRFSPEALDWGLTRDPSGALALHGPVPPGSLSLALQYWLPVEHNPARFERRFESPVPLLEVLVADTGVVPESSRLHPRRPARGEDRNFLQLEGFAIGSGETVSLDLRRIDAARGLPRLATLGFVVLVGLAALHFLTAPLRAADTPPAAEDDSARLEREALYRSIEDLDEDFDTGKLSAGDHERMRAELRARAVALLREQRDGQKPGPAGATPVPHCPACQAALRDADRFCSQCGARIEADPVT